MTNGKIKLARGISVAIILAQSAMTVARSSDELSLGEIFKTAREKYAALTSYSDEGKAVATLNGSTVTTTFTIKLAKPNLYRIAWEQNISPGSSFKGKSSAVWSAGEGDFLDMGGRKIIGKK